MEPPEKEEQARLSFLLPKELHRRARIKSVTVGRPLADFLREVLEKWVQEDAPSEQDEVPPHDTDAT